MTGPVGGVDGGAAATVTSFSARMFPCSFMVAPALCRGRGRRESQPQHLMCCRTQEGQGRAGSYSGSRARSVAAKSSARASWTRSFSTCSAALCSYSRTR